MWHAVPIPSYCVLRILENLLEDIDFICIYLSINFFYIIIIIILFISVGEGDTTHPLPYIGHVTSIYYTTI